MLPQLFDLVEYTHRNIFLTGKAGTGKTYFLNNFVKRTKKKHIVLAPTGIAAINAGGVTIHSMFGLPLRPFLPTLDKVDIGLVNNISHLLPYFKKYKKEKLQLLRRIDLIIIDEVSMLRADVLDMMDFALRSVRRNSLRFGGVQILFIGDLFQLPPVLTDKTKYIFRKYYDSAFFFDSLALKDTPVISIELTEVFRQKDKNFLDILNHIREGNISKVDFMKLNERYIPDFEPKEEVYVSLCSHNKMADSINQRKLKEIKSASFFYESSVYGDFKENNYPNNKFWSLK